MSIQTQTFTANGTFTVPSTLVGTKVQFSVSGGRGCAFPGQTAAAQVSGQLAITPTQQTFLVVIGHDAFGSIAGAGFSGGGGGGGWEYGNADPFYGGAGGGSTAVLLPDSTLYIEAGGGDGTTRSFGVGTPGSYTGMSGASFYPGGSGGGYASNTPRNAQNVGMGAGSGGSQGGNGGAGFTFGSAAGGTGHGGGTNGNAGVFAASGAGVGSGGLATPGAASSFVTAAPNVVNSTYGRANVATPPQAVFSYHVADAPAAPLLLAPAANGFLNAQGAGVTFQGQYQAPSVDTGVLSGVILSQRVGTGPLHYWNGTDFSSTTPVVVTPTSGSGATSGEPFTVVIPPSALTNGSAYIWTMACTESLFGLQGPYAATQSFTAVAPPTATITNPVGTVGTVTPTISWTNTTPSGAQKSYRFLIYTTPQNLSGIAPPPPGALYDSGVVASAATSFVLPAGLLRSVESYYGYLQIVNTTGSIPSLWTAAGFTVAITSANTVTLSVTSGTDPASTMPAPRLVMTMTGADALTSAWFQADYGDGNGFVDIIAGLQPIVAGGATVYDLGAPFNQAISYRVRAGGVLIGNQVLSAWSSTVNLALPGISSGYWWVVPPTAQATSMQISRLPATGATSSANANQTITQPTMPAGITASLTVEEWEQQGVFRGFGRKTAVVVHGDLWEREFDLSVYFADPTSFDNFADIREAQSVVLLKSDMEGQLYWITLGPDFNPGIFRETGRRKSPKRALLIHCTPTDPYVPDNPFVPTD